jgi:hypothetical protein
MFRYWGFGLKIVSDIEFPELFPYDFESEDIKIVLGRVSLPEEMTQTKLGNMAITDDSFFLDTYPTAKYFSSNGRNLTIEPYSSDAEHRTIRLYALATAITSILAQRKLIPLHASAVLVNGRLMLITGESTSGKSTTIAGLLKKGYEIFSDDVVVLNPLENSQIGAFASYPMIKLWDDTVDKLKHSLFEDKTFKVRHDLEKFGFFFHDKFLTRAYPIERIIVLSRQDVPSLISTPLKDFGAFYTLRKHLYRPFLFNSRELQLLQFDLMSKLVNNCEVYSVVRPHIFEAEVLQNFIERLINE